MTDQPTYILYEVYDKRALHEGIDDLPLLDRDTNRKKAEDSAGTWGGCVAEVTCRVVTWHPMQREVVRFRIVWVHRPAPVQTAIDTVGVKELRGQFNSTGYHPRKRGPRY